MWFIAERRVQGNWLADRDCATTAFSTGGNLPPPSTMPTEPSQENSPEGNSDLRLNKKMRLDGNEYAAIKPGRCHLSRMPFELLAEILVNTTGPQDALTLARCSKFFCATLVTNPSSKFIWRRLRAICKPLPIPDPTPNFTESSFAAFLFDGGSCEVGDVSF